MTGQVVIDTLGELYQNGIGFDGSLAFNIFSGATTSGATLMPLVSDYSAWKYRTKVKVQNPPEIEAQAKFTVSHQTGMAQDFADLRFSTLQGQEIPYWIESQVDGSEAVVWLKLPAYATRVYAYWGNTSAVSESSVTTETLDNTPTLSLMTADFNPYYCGYVWNAFKYCKTVIPSVLTDVDAAVPIQVSYVSAMKSDFSDVRFATGDGVALEYWRETYTSGTSADFWIKLPSNTSQIKMYYGNSSAEYTGDGNSTFVSFIDGSHPNDEDYNEIGAVNQFVDQYGDTYSSVYSGSGQEAMWNNLPYPMNKYRMKMKAGWSGSGYSHIRFWETDINSNTVTLIGVAAAQFGFTPHDGNGYYNSSSHANTASDGGTTVYHLIQNDMDLTTQNQKYYENGTLILDGGIYSTGYTHVNSYTIGRPETNTDTAIRLSWFFVTNLPEADPTFTFNPQGYTIGYYLYDWSNYEHQSTILVEDIPSVHTPTKFTFTKADYSVNADLSDLRFCDVDGNYLPYWVEDNNTTVTVWTVTPANATRFFMRSGYSSATNESSAFDSVLYFNGGEDYVNCGNDISIQMGNIFSVSFWVKIDDLADHHYLVSKGHGLGSGNGWAITYYAGTMKLYFDVHHIDGTRNIVAISYPNDNDYHYVEATFDNGIMYLSIDGSGYTSDKGNLVFDDTLNNLLISKPSSTSWCALTGTISDVKLWNMGELVAYYPMRENTSTTLYDYVGNNNGTIYNATWVDGILPLGDIEPTLYVLPEGYSPEYVLDISGFTKKAQITISNPHTSRYPVRLTVPYAASMQADFSDLEFVDALGRRCPHWIEAYTASTEAQVWVLTPAGLSTIDMYYGATGWTNTSNGEQVFHTFDDFDLPLDAEPSGQWVFDKFNTEHADDWAKADGSSGMVISKGADRGSVFLKTRHKFPCGMVAIYRTKRSISNYGAYMFGPGEPAGEYGGSGNEWFGTLGFNTIMLKIRDATSATHNQIAGITESGGLLYSWVNGEPIYDALDTPKTHKMIWNEAELRLFSNGLYSGHYKSGTAIQDSYFAFMQGYYNGTGTITVDWIGLYQQAPVEPTLSIGVEESIGATGTDYVESAVTSMSGSLSTGSKLDTTESFQVQNNSVLNVSGWIAAFEQVSLQGRGLFNSTNRLDFNSTVQVNQVHQTIVNTLVDAIIEVQLTNTQEPVAGLGAAYREQASVINTSAPSTQYLVDYNALIEEIAHSNVSIEQRAQIVESVWETMAPTILSNTQLDIRELVLVNGILSPDISNNLGVSISVVANQNQTLTIRLNKNLSEVVEALHSGAPDFSLGYILEATIRHLQYNPQVTIPEIIRFLVELSHNNYYNIVFSIESTYNIELTLRGGGNE